MESAVTALAIQNGGWMITRGSRFHQANAQGFLTIATATLAAVDSMQSRILGQALVMARRRARSGV